MKKFLSFLSNIHIKKFFHKQIIKKVLIYTTVILLLLTPLFLAKLCQQLVRNQTNTLSVTIYDSDGTLIASEEGLVESAARYSLLDSFYKIHTNKKEISYAPGDPATDRYITATLNLNGTKSTMKCFFSLNGMADYLIDTNNKIYTVPSLYTKNFLASSYAASFYDTATPPALVTIDNDTVMPTKSNWNYKNNESKFVNLIKQDYSARTTPYELTGMIGLSFTQNPDQCTAHVSEQGQSVYEGDLNGLAQLTVKSNSELNIKITAVWKQKSDAIFYGTVQYDFKVHIRNRSLFTISSDTVYPGEWILLTGTNISDPSQIIFSADWCSPPTFYQEGNRVYTLLPISNENEATSLQFEITHGASSQSFRIALLPKQTSSFDTTESDFLSDSDLTEETLNSYQNAIRTLPSNKNYKIYFRGKFSNPSTELFQIGYRHGDAIETEQGTLKLIGTEYCTKDSSEQPVFALNHGTVLHVGATSALGNYVVIDHGCGLLTWYCHLSRVDVVVGEAIQKDQTLGRTGSFGIATGNGFLLICTINQTLIDPAFITGKQIKSN